MPNPPNNKVIAGAIAAALALAAPSVQKWEGNKNYPYHDVINVLTVCDGHTGPDVVLKKYYPPEECKALLEQDLDKTAKAVLKVTPNIYDKPYIFASAISFTYNVGSGTYAKSSVARDFKAGNYKQGCKDLLKYVYAEHKYLKGLDNRRQDEYQICMKGT